MRIRLFRFLLIIFFIVPCPINIFAQSEDLDSLFDEEPIVEVIEEEQSEQDLGDKLLSTETLQWGGRLESEFTTKFIWTEDYPDNETIREPDSNPFITNLGATLFFDARPLDDFRVFGCVKTYYPFQTGDTGFNPGIQVFELFSDFNWQDYIYLRAGKHTIKWGVGYFFSPADVLNLAPIDPQEAEVQREGTLSLKTQIPLDVHNIYLYVIANNIEKPDELALAPKLEFLIGNVETAICGFYQKDLAPRGMLMFTGPLWVFDIFSEAVLQYGSDKIFIEDEFETYEEEDDIFFSGTIGFSFMDPALHLLVAGQYLFNSQGYDDPEPFQDYALLHLMNQNISIKDMLFPGRHYGAFMFDWQKLADSDFGISLFWMGNFTDLSGYFVPALSWSPLDYASISLQAAIHYGDEETEFRQDMTVPGQKKTFELSIIATLGAGNF